MAKMYGYKIAFLISHPIQYYAPLFKKLSEHPRVNLTVYFCLRAGSEKWDIPLLEGYKHVFLKNYSLKPAPTFFGQINPGIIRELKKNKYDAVIVHGYTACTNWLAFFGAWRTKTPIIIKGEAVFSNGVPWWKKLVKKIFLGYMLKRVQAALYAYKANKDFFRLYSVPEEKLFFYPCAVDNEFFQRRSKELKDTEELMKREVGLKHTDWPVVLFVGKCIARKRVIDLLRAAIKLKNRIDINLLIVGDGPEKAALAHFVKENNLENVHFTGFKNQSELPAYYRIADVFVLPSAFDPSPKAMNEAMNFSLPVVATNGVKTAPDMIVENNAGFVYPVGDVEALSSCIEKIIKDNALREKLGRNALRAVGEWNFSRDVEGIIEAVDYVHKI